jgi:ACR3 family arsenite transporter
MFFNFLIRIKKNLIISILIAMILGLIIGYYFDTTSLKVLITPLTFMLVYPTMVALNLGSLREKANIKLQVTTQLLNFILFPLVAYVLGLLFFSDNSALRLGLLLMSLLPTSGMTISWTVMAKGNVNSAIRMVVIGLLLGALLSPLYITVLLGAEVNVPIFKIFTQIFIVVFVPLILAFLTQVILKKIYGQETFHKKIKPKFPLFSILGVVLIIFTAISLKAKLLVNDPSILLQMIIPLILFYATTMFVPLFIGKKFFTREDAIALSNGTLVRNLSLSLAIVLSAFEGAGIAALLIAVAYVLQVQLAAWNVKLAQKIY